VSRRAAFLRCVCGYGESDARDARMHDHKLDKDTCKDEVRSVSVEERGPLLRSHGSWRWPLVVVVVVVLGLVVMR
jgi:hypothetical protein